MDLREEAERERQRRLQGAAPQINDAANTAGRFGLIERRKQQEQERIEAARRGQAIDLLRRSLGREPSAEEIEDALGR